MKAGARAETLDMGVGGGNIFITPTTPEVTQ